MENQVLLTKRKFHFFIYDSYSGPVRNSTFPFLSVYYTWMCLQCGTSGKEPPCQRGKHKKYGFDPWVEKIPWRRALQPTPVFLTGEFPMDRGAWWATVCGVAKSWTRLSDFHMEEQGRAGLGIWDLANANYYIYVWVNHFAVHQNLTHWKSTILQ